MSKKSDATGEHVLALCEGLRGSELTFPFGEEVCVFKVGSKMFALVSMDEEPARLTLKCEPDHVIYLTQNYDDIVPGYHMNKRHWITATLSSNLPSDLVDDLIVDSYELVVSTLPSALRQEFRRQGH